MVRARKVEPEARADIVYDKDYSLFVAELSDLCPLFFCGADIVVEIAVIIRLGNEARYVAVAFIVGGL